MFIWPEDSDRVKGVGGVSAELLDHPGRGMQWASCNRRGCNGAVSLWAAGRSGSPVLLGGKLDSARSCF